MFKEFYDLDSALLVLEAEGFEQQPYARYLYGRADGARVELVQELGGTVELRAASRGGGVDEMDERLRALVLQKLAIVEAGLPGGVSLEGYLWESDVRDEVARGDRGRELGEAYAWLQGVADAFDVLVTQVVEEAGDAGEWGNARRRSRDSVLKRDVTPRGD